MKKIIALAFSVIAFSNAAHADIVIGVSAPLTGPAASVAEISLPGLKQAVEDVNAKGGINNQKLKLDIMDDACDPKQAVQAANKLVSANVVAVISTSCSGSSQAAAPVYEEEGLPFLVAVASAPEITRQGYKTLFRPGSRDDQDAGAAAHFVAGKFAGKSVAVIDDKGTWGKAIGGLFSDDLKQAGFKTVDRYSLNTGEQDFSALIGKLKAKNYDVVYTALFMREAGLLVRQMKEQHYNPVIVGSITLAMNDFTAIVGPAKDGIYFTHVPLTDRAAALAKKLQSREMESVYNVQSYSAVEILAQVLAKAGPKPADMLAALHGGTFDTAFGPVKFTPAGDIADMKFDVWQHTAQGPQLVK